MNESGKVRFFLFSFTYRAQRTTKGSLPNRCRITSFSFLGSSPAAAFTTVCLVFVCRKDLFLDVFPSGPWHLSAWMDEGSLDELHPLDSADAEFETPVSVTIGHCCGTGLTTGEL